jgi:DNA mismatch endonuclease, patch repair protein
MTDHVDPIRRSAIMAAVNSKDTGPEVALRRMLHRLGYRYVVHNPHLPGTPDIVFPSRGKVILVHGCFWHRHYGCRYATVPKTRTAFWEAKFRSNEARDASNLKALRKLGWQVQIVWQCQLKSPERLLRRLVRFLGPTRRTKNGDL